MSTPVNGTCWPFYQLSIALTMVRYVLYESSVGYGLFQVTGVDQVEINSPKFQQSITKFEKFSTVCSLKAFYNFPTPEIALENQNDIAEGIQSLV